MRLNSILFCTFLACFFVNGQDKKTKRAEADFNNYAYAEAIDTYENLVEKGYASEEIFKNLGNANYRNANYEAASDWYGKLFKLEETNIDAEYFYKYALSLKSLGKYEESNLWMGKFETSKGNDTRAIKFADNPDYLNKIKENSGRYDIKNLALNSTTSDFAPSFYGKELVFSSARDTGRVIRSIHEWNNKPFLNLYRSMASEDWNYTSAVKLSKSLNKKTHESSTAFTKDGSTVYFTRNNSENGKFARDKGGLSRLKIYRATLQDGEWQDILELPFNSDEYSTAHPTLSTDEKQLYFASDMPGSKGQSDIFVVAINSDGSYGTPKNLGSKINTEGRETFPFVAKDDVLYFSSDGHPGLGGLDVFATQIKDFWKGYVINLGKPINGQRDDFSFIIDSDTKKGFFASNREGGRGSDDIYGFTENKELNLNSTILVEGMAKDMDKGQPLARAKVAIFDDKNELIGETETESDGSFAIKANCREGRYKLVALKNEYDPSDVFFTVANTNDITGMEMLLEKIVKQATVGTDLIKFLNLSPVYFDLNESEIRPDAQTTLAKVLEYMRVFPNLKVEVQSHTDAKAGANYNKRLSERRAKSTVEYLVDKGIENNRISGQGFGETRLLNDCTSREKCEDGEHQLNRRSEFIVID